MEQRPTGPRSDLEERRLLTIMFGDMVGSTTLSEAIGADSMHELLKLYRSACHQAVVDHDGVLSSWMGDGFMAHFGYPTRHEDAAVRAVEAGLAVLADVRALAPQLTRRFGVQVDVRIGIHTGLVVVTEAPGREQGPDAVSFVGETPNIAARIESTAAPNSVSITGATFELVRGWFDVDHLGPQELRGFTRRFTTYRVRSRTSATSRYFARGGPLTPLVGRDVEIADLVVFAHGSGRDGVAFHGLVGEAGMGKTRLLDELVHQVGPVRDLLYCACSPRDTASALYPFARLLAEIAGARGPGAAASVESFASRVAPDVPDRTSRARLAALAGIEPGSGPPAEVTPERALRETSAALRAWLLRRGERGAVLLVDDAQWLDPTSRGLLIRLAREASALGVVLAHRPDPDTAWVTEVCGSHTELRPLGLAESADLIRRVVDGDEERVAEAAVRSDGVPLFAEELGRTLGRGELLEFGSMPETLHDLVVSRLDRIPEARMLAQVGASIGREFPVDLLVATTGLPERAVIDQAGILESARIWERSDARGVPAFAFRHALLQDASYDSQIRERKQEVHARLADVLVERGEGASADGLAVVARHLENAGPDRRAAAVERWIASGYATATAGAHAEAVSRFARGLELLPGIEDAAVAAGLELPLQLGLGASLSTTAGYGHEPVRAAFARARELCALMGGPPELYPAVWGLWSFHLVRAEYGVADELARSCARIAAVAQDPALDIETSAALGITAFYRGLLSEAIGHLSASADRYAATRAITPFQRFQHPAVAALSHLALARALGGDPGGAWRAAADAVELADSCEDHLRWYAQEYAHTFCAALGAYLGDASSCLRHAQRAIEVCSRYGSRMFLAGAQIYQGHAQVALGAVGEGLPGIEGACDSYLRTGAILFRPYHLALLATARSSGGDHMGALAAADAAVELAERTGELVHLPAALARRAYLASGRFGNAAAVRADDERARALAGHLGIDRSVLGAGPGLATVPDHADEGEGDRDD